MSALTVTLGADISALKRSMGQTSLNDLDKAEEVSKLRSP
jgi:hypothetical protein